MKLLNRPPCPKCPYMLGHVKFIKDPCPECKENHYRMYEKLTKGKRPFDTPAAKE